MKNILIVDDDVELRANISDILKEAEYHPEEAASGKEAVEKISSGDFDVVLLDLMMPGMNGIEALSEIRKIKPKTKVIMITAFATVENAVDAVKKGASDYISKPFKIDNLLTVIRRTLEETRFENSMKKLDIENTLASLSNPIRRNIIQYLHLKSASRLMEITRALNIEDHTKVVFHLKTLRESGIIEQDREKSYFLTKEGERIIALLKVLEDHLSTT
jgi:DNA-binding NtrC family response regulator